MKFFEGLFLALKASSDVRKLRRLMRCLEECYPDDEVKIIRVGPRNKT